MNNAVLTRLSIFRNRSYSLYFLGTTVSLIGSGMQLIANSWLILEMTGSGYSVAILLVFSSLPNILFSPFSGVLVDRINRQLLATCMDLFRALIFLSISLLWFLKLVQPWHLYLMAFLVAIADGLFSPTVKALIREVVPQEMLLVANSTTSIANQIGSLLGAGGAGIIIALFSPAIVMVANAGTFVVSAFCIANMHRNSTLEVQVKHKSREWQTFFIEFKEGISYCRQHPKIIHKYLVLLFLLTTLRTINVLLAPFAKNVLHVGVKEFAFIDASFAIGAIVSGFVLPWLTQTYGVKQVMTNGIWALSASLMFFSASQSLWMAILGYFLIGVTFQVWVLYLTDAQNSTDNSYQGRVYSLFSTFMSIGSSVVYLIMGTFGELFSPRWSFGFQSILVAITGLVNFRVLFCNRKSEDNHAEF